MSKTLCWAILVGTTLLRVPAPAPAAGDGQVEPGLREHTRGERHGSRPNRVRRRAAPGRQVRSTPGVWWAPAEPALPAAGPPVVVIQGSPVAIPEAPPPAPQEPPYYWYACDPEGKGSSPREPAAAFCVGGLHPSLRGFPGPGKTLEQFQADAAACQRWASAHAGTLPGVAASEPAVSSAATGANPTPLGSMQMRFDFAYQQCLHATGNQVRVVAGPGQPTYPPPPSLP